LTLHGAIYRLILGAIVLAIIIPASMSGQPIWPFALIAVVVVVVVVGILAARQPRLGAWLRHR